MQSPVGSENVTEATAAAAAAATAINAGHKVSPTVQEHEGDGGQDKALTSRFRGVCWNKKNKRWQAAINSSGKYVYLGSFQSEEEAARAFDKAAIKLRGARAKLNYRYSDYVDGEGNLLHDDKLKHAMWKIENITGRGEGEEGDEGLEGCMPGEDDRSARGGHMRVSNTSRGGLSGPTAHAMAATAAAASGGDRPGLEPSGAKAFTLGRPSNQVTTSHGHGQGMMQGSQQQMQQGAHMEMERLLATGPRIPPHVQLSVQRELPEGSTLLSLVPNRFDNGKEDMCGALYLDMAASDLFGSAVWTGSSIIKMGLYDTERDARQACIKCMQLYWAFCSDDHRVDVYSSLSAVGAAAMHASAQAPMLPVNMVGGNVSLSNGNDHDRNGSGGNGGGDYDAGFRSGLASLRNADLLGRLSGGFGGGLNSLSSLQLAQLSQEPGSLLVEELTMPSMGMGINFSSARGMQRMSGLQQMGVQGRGSSLNSLAGLQGLGVNMGGMGGMDSLNMPMELRQLPIGALSQLPIAEMQLQGSNLKQLLYMHGNSLNASPQGGGDEALSSRLSELMSLNGKRALPLTGSLGMALDLGTLPMPMAPPANKRPRGSGDGSMLTAQLEFSQLNKLSEMNMPTLLSTLRAAGLSNVQ